MDRTRLETFTDGIFAIVVTLLVLDIKLPVNTTVNNLDSNLIHLLPSLATYALSFIIVGLYWIFHQAVAQRFKSINTRVMWLNIIHLLFVGLIPFTTSLMSRYTFSTWAIVIYGGNILAINLAGWSVTKYFYNHPELHEGKFTHLTFIAQRRQYIKIALLYASGIVMAFFVPEISIYIYAFVTGYLVLGTVVDKLSWRGHAG